MLSHQNGVKDEILGGEFHADVAPNFKKTWHDVANIEELYDFMQGPLCDSFYPDAADMPQPILMSNYLLGSIQIRQMRVSSEMCSSVSQRVLGPNGTCTGKWELDREQSAEPIGRQANPALLI